MDEPTALPVLDISEFRRDPSSPGATDLVRQLRDVVHEVGFFYITGHGVSEDLADRAQRVAREFFALPEADRLEIENVGSPQFRGYTRFGHEVTNGRADLREQVDIGRDMPARTIGPDDPQWLRLRGPNLWPSALPEFRDVFTDWSEELEVVGQTLLQAMALALGQPADLFSDVVTPPEVLLKVIRYVTPVDDGSLPSESIAARQGVGAHRDTGFLSFVHQDEVGGLQVERDGHLVDVPAIRGALVVNVGEMFQLVTRGYFKATVHRVVSPPPGVERISIAYFFNPKLEATLEPIDMPEELAAIAPGGASADPSNPILANYGDNSLKVRLRAHPDVAERHHADLLATGAWGRG
jgi:isopenicillin N synthase-like dioxygenase